MFERKSQEVYKFLQQHHADSSLKFGALHYLSQHPKTRFGLDVMAGALTSGKKAEVVEALSALEKEGLVKKSNNGKTIYYSLTAESELGKTISQVSPFEWHQVELHYEHEEISKVEEQTE